MNRVRLPKDFNSGFGSFYVQDCLCGETESWCKSYCTNTKAWKLLKAFPAFLPDVEIPFNWCNVMPRDTKTSAIEQYKSVANKF